MLHLMLQGSGRGYHGDAQGSTYNEAFHGTHRSAPYIPVLDIPNGNEVAVIRASRGTIRVQLGRQRKAPVTASNFIELAALGFYDKLKFHAHKPGSVVLGGCPPRARWGLHRRWTRRRRGMIRGIHPGIGDARYTIVDEWET